MEVLTREQSRRVDQLAMEELGLPGIVLMENAARGLASIALEMAGDRDGIVGICCGPGNNGGDGLALARHLVNAGRAVRIHLAVPGYAEGSDPAIHLGVARAMGLPIESGPPAGTAALWVDGLFGTGLTRAVEGAFRSAIEALNGSGAPTLAIDIPSGLDADTGLPHGIAVRAAVTGTLVAPKVGFRRGEGASYTGEVRVVDIGVPLRLIARVTAGS